jgi:hypothetical protein
MLELLSVGTDAPELTEREAEQILLRARALRIRSLVGSVLAGVVALLLVVGVYAWSVEPGQSSSVRIAPAEAPPATTLPESRGAEGLAHYPQDLVDLAWGMAATQSDLISYRETDEGPLLLVTKVDWVVSLVAEMAHQRGLPYLESDRLYPVRDEQGMLVRYGASNIGRFLTIAEVTAPGFDLCAIQVAEAERMDRVHPAGVPIAQGTPRQRLNC